MNAVKSITAKEIFRLHPDVKQILFMGGGQILDNSLLC
jgi:hypothetical protein